MRHKVKIGFIVRRREDRDHSHSNNADGDCDGPLSGVLRRRVDDVQDMSRYDFTSM